MTATKLYESLHDGIHDEAGTMARYFDSVFTRVAMWSTEQAQQHFVDDVPIGIGQGAEMECLSFGSRQ